jgi:hypothetical protein
MTKTILRRLRQLEARFREPPRDLSGWSTDDLDEVERHMSQLMALRSADRDWLNVLPRRLQRLVARTWPDH